MSQTACPWWSSYQDRLRCSRSRGRRRRSALWMCCRGSCVLPLRPLSVSRLTRRCSRVHHQSPQGTRRCLPRRLHRIRSCWHRSRWVCCPRLPRPRRSWWGSRRPARSRCFGFRDGLAVELDWGGGVDRAAVCVATCACLAAVAAVAAPAAGTVCARLSADAGVVARACLAPGFGPGGVEVVIICQVGTRPKPELHRVVGEPSRTEPVWSRVSEGRHSHRLPTLSAV